MLWEEILIDHFVIIAVVVVIGVIFGSAFVLWSGRNID